MTLTAGVSTTGRRQRLDGLAGNDTIVAGAGNDAMVGGLNSDSCNGRLGIDTATTRDTVLGVP